MKRVLKRGSIPVAVILVLVVLLSASSGLYAGASFFAQQAPNVTVTTTILTTTTSWTTSTIWSTVTAVVLGVWTTVQYTTSTSTVTVTGATSNRAAKIVTAKGNAQISVAQSKFGGTSGLFHGTGDYLLAANSADFNFGTGDFTIDFWVRRDGTQGDYACLIAANDVAHMNGWTLDMNSGANIHKLRWITKGSGTYAVDITASSAVADATWTHVAIVRYGNTVTMYLNGASVGSKDVTGWTINSAGTGLVVARQFTDIAGYYYKGWIDELRISKGVALWTNNFTPPTSAPTGDSNTVLLLHMDGAAGSNTFIDG